MASQTEQKLQAHRELKETLAGVLADPRLQGDLRVSRSSPEATLDTKDRVLENRMWAQLRGVSEEALSKEMDAAWSAHVLARLLEIKRSLRGAVTTPGGDFSLDAVVGAPSPFVTLLTIGTDGVVTAAGSAVLSLHGFATIGGMLTSDVHSDETLKLTLERSEYKRFLVAGDERRTPQK